ncbi:MAG: FmdB family transcriptional regulator [Dehalococcoidia bacterium]|nr:MAG: FmdB family transcriptional regulator [Dehalococcoidia bacterium]
MPIYEYACQTGGHRFEVKQKFSDAPLAHCPECGGSVRRLIFPAGIVFKGSGFYKTDYANGSRSERTDESSRREEGGSSASTPAESTADRSP